VLTDPAMKGHANLNLVRCLRGEVTVPNQTGGTLFAPERDHGINPGSPPRRYKTCRSRDRCQQ